MQDLVKYVNPNVGTIGHLLTATKPNVQYPHGMMMISPDFTPGITDRYIADKIFSFPVGPVSVMAARINREYRGREDAASVFDHDNETACPHMYSVYLETFDITAMYSVTRHGAIFEFDFGAEPGDVILSAGENVNIGNVVTACGKYFDVHSAAFIRFYKNGEGIQANAAKIAENTYKFRFTGGKITLKAAISFIDVEQAEDNFKRELDGKKLEDIIELGYNVWNRELNKIKVSGSEKHKRIFYTAMYRAMSRMYNLSEYGRYYSNYDKKVHDNEGHDFYCGDGLWDTFRCMHPLQLILEPDTHEDVLESYVRMYRQSGLMPNFPYPSRDYSFMIGFHSASLFADAYVKGITFDLETAYEGVRKNVFGRSMLPWVNAPSTELDEIYYKKGFFPALRPGEPETVKEVHGFEGRQAVAVTLEHSYTDWCAKILAQAAGRYDDVKILNARSKNYANLFNRGTKFMSPRGADGKFIENFNPKLSGGQGGRLYFAENNAWTFTFSVFHDIEGLIELFGGKEEFSNRLDMLFTEQYEVSKYDFLRQFPDSTGLIGQYSQGNEPGFHIPYLYNYIGEPHKTQRKIHEIINLWYHDHPLGICGDEDGGAMSAWLVFSAMGFYPVCPGKAEYAIGSPIFDYIEIKAPAAELTIIADGVVNKAKYISSANIGGKKIGKKEMFLHHGDLYGGKTLTLKMQKNVNRLGDHD